MTKRFFIGYSLITFFLLNSVVLLAQHKASFVQQWKIEDASHALQIIERADYIRIDSSGRTDYVVSATIDGRL